MAGQRPRLLSEYRRKIAGLRIADDDECFICNQAATVTEQMVDGVQIGLWSVNSFDLWLSHIYPRQRQRWH